MNKPHFFEHKHKIWLIILLFMIILSPWALQFLLFFPDENHYSDGAMFMLEHGDLLTPHRADGSLRFNKPIFNYWVVLGSYKLFGISEWSTRLPFLLCGGLILLVMHQLGKLIFNVKKYQLLPAIILSANPLFAFTITKSITDTYLLLFVTLTIYGVIGCLTYGSKTIPKRFLWAIYVGCGLATMTKGIPAVVFTAIGGLYLLLNPWKRFTIKQLFHIPSLITGILLALFWYVAIYLQHGDTALQEFYGDQVGERFEMTIAHFLKNLGGMLSASLLCFFPFAFLFFSPKKDLSKTEKAIVNFGFVYYFLLLIMASFTASFYYRYLLQGFSLLAVVLSILMIKQQSHQALKNLKVSNIILTSLLSILTVASLFNAWVFQSKPFDIFLFGIGILGIIALIVLLSKPTFLHQTTKTALLMSTFFWVVAFIVKPISQPGMGNQIVESTERLGIDLGQETVQLYAKQQPGGKFRVATKGKVFIPHRTDTEITKIPNDTYVIFKKGLIESFDTTGLQRRIVANYWGDLPYDKVIKARLNGNYEQIKAENATEYMLVWRE